MEEEKKNKGHVNNLLEDGWFFGNTLLSSKANSSKIMVRCNSDPCPSSSSKEAILVSRDASANPKTSNSNSNSNPLFRTPSLPPCFGRDQKFEQDHDEEHEKNELVEKEEVVVVKEVEIKEEEEEEEEEEEPRMGDLIRQAMPTMPLPMSCRRLNRAPSLPPCWGKDALINTLPNIVQNNGPGGAGRLTRRSSIDSSSSSGLVREKSPIGMTKLSRRASIDCSMVLPPKYTSSKGMKQGASKSKKRTQRKQELPVINEPTNTETRTQNHHLDKTMSLKSLSELEIEELQGFKDLGFSFETDKVTPNVAKKLPAGLQRKGSIDSNFKNTKFHTRPYVSDSLWDRKPGPSSQLSAPPVMKRPAGDQKSAEDIKAQIKFWARAVASNVRQEC